MLSIIVCVKQKYSQTFKWGQNVSSILSVLGDMYEEEFNFSQREGAGIRELVSEKKIV